MKNHISEKNKDKLLAKNKRHKNIFEIIDQEELTTANEIVEELRKRNIATSQPTVHRDLKELGIKKNINNIFEPTEEIHKNFHLDLIYDLLITHNAHTSSNVATYFISTEKGKAQEIAFHMEKAFSNIILKTIVGLDNIVVLVDGDEITEEFHNIFASSVD
ncbi:hypothetical protein [Sediminibacillus halophilus]|uniref:Transcriptional regulator of arginine metabolism n=1 Tax=Sediminibacillus halophilus TaxID=482461 RepID=A0A1G9T4K1_9BACI|nr:hypothetical protein [Sediminibacillus halophilus]SDM42611.1 transcriptional regulator of arginine metabolism [Sediminibacillus halophilus]